MIDAFSEFFTRIIMDFDPLPFATATLLDRIGRLTQAECFTDSLRPVQWSALRWLGHNSAGKRTVGSLAEFFGVSHSSASRTVAVLARKGLVSVDAERTKDRTRRIALTPRGWDALSQDPLRRLARVIALLPPHEKVALHNTLTDLLGQMTVPAKDDDNPRPKKGS